VVWERMDGSLESKELSKLSNYVFCVIASDRMPTSDRCGFRETKLLCTAATFESSRDVAHKPETQNVK
jgi:hypothetical protein